MADLTLRPAYATVAEEDGTLWVTFAEGEDEDEPYAVFSREGGGPVALELNDPDFVAEDAVERLRIGPKGLEVAIRPAAVARLGWAASVAIRLGPGCEGADEAVAALRVMLGPAVEG